MHSQNISIRKAKIVLKRIGHITNRLEARAKARVELDNHIKKIKKKPSDKKFNKLNLLINSVMNEEINLAKCNVIETQRVKDLKEIIRLMHKKHDLMETKLDELKKESEECQKIKKMNERRERALETKMKRKIDKEMAKKIEILEEKYKEYKKSGSLSKTELNKIKKRIDKLKISIHLK